MHHQASVSMIFSFLQLKIVCAVDLVSFYFGERLILFCQHVITCPLIRPRSLLTPAAGF